MYYDDDDDDENTFMTALEGKGEREDEESLTEKGVLTCLFCFFGVLLSASKFWHPVLLFTCIFFVCAFGKGVWINEIPI
jgi:hypothetical protein